MSLHLIDPHGKKVKFFGSHKNIAKVTGLSVASIDSLSSGRRVSIKGWLSCHNKVKKQVKEIIDNFTLHNIETGEIAYTWNRREELKELHHLNHITTWKMKSGKKPIIKNWTTKKTYDLLYGL